MPEDQQKSLESYYAEMRAAIKSQNKFILRRLRKQLRAQNPQASRAFFNQLSTKDQDFWLET